MQHMVDVVDRPQGLVYARSNPFGWKRRLVGSNFVGRPTRDASFESLTANAIGTHVAEGHGTEYPHRQ